MCWISRDLLFHVPFDVSALPTHLQRVSQGIPWCFPLPAYPGLPCWRSARKDSLGKVCSVDTGNSGKSPAPKLCHKSWDHSGRGRRGSSSWKSGKFSQPVVEQGVGNPQQFCSSVRGNTRILSLGIWGYFRVENGFSPLPFPEKCDFSKKSISALILSPKSQ